MTNPPQGPGAPDDSQWAQRPPQQQQAAPQQAEPGLAEASSAAMALSAVICIALWQGRQAGEGRLHLFGCTFYSNCFQQFGFLLFENIANTATERCPFSLFTYHLSNVL
mgnify:CR=1 FL=1